MSLFLSLEDIPEVAAAAPPKPKAPAAATVAPIAASLVDWKRPPVWEALPPALGSKVLVPSLAEVVLAPSKASRCWVEFLSIP